jgi:hypothetical protein
MLRNLTCILLMFVLAAQSAPPETARPYEDPEAYQVYAALLATPESNKHAGELAVMARRTLVFENCYEPDEKWRKLLIPAVENYKEINRSPWDLVDSRIQFVHKLISADDMHALFSKGPKRGWKSFHRKYPHRALLFVSAVGFNPDKTVAVVATESDCGALCGSAGMSFLRKVDGVWEEFHPTGTVCVVNH